MIIRVNDLMTKEVITIEPHHKVSHAIKIFKKNNINILPIVSQNKLIGVISQCDILGKKNTINISSIMNTELITIPPYSNVELAAKLMKKYKIHHLLVTMEKELIGVLSSYDLIDLINHHKFKSTHCESNHKRVA